MNSLHKALRKHWGPLTPTERRFKEMIERRKIAVVRPAWPDFICVENGKLFCVEVKSGKNWVSDNQRHTFDLLAEHGIDVFIWHHSYRKLFAWRDVRTYWNGRNHRSKPLAANLRAAKQGSVEEAPEEGWDSVQGT